MRHVSAVSLPALLLATLSFCFTGQAFSQAPAVATGDSRTVTEPAFPATCQTLQASFHDTNEDVPASVESVSTNLDQARLQAALTACQGTAQAVRLSMDASGNNSFLSGPLSIPGGVTLLVDPGVTVYFSRNAQDYDNVAGQHLCGTVSGNSNTASCKNLISINQADGAGIMGYGKLNGRGGDVVLNSFPTPGYEGSTTGKTWWDLANDATTYSGSQQNPRFVQVTKSNNVTMYKITMKNAPNFHVAINVANALTIWGLHVVTPYNAHNTDGVDPGNATNVTIRESWISDGDDNIALGANSAPTANISVIHNKFFAGHGESIGSLTTYGVSNALFDDNAMYGDAEVDGSNSTGIRIKSANDRGGLVQNIQYSNSCLADHGTQVQFTPIYNTNAGTLTPNFKNILLQNLRFSNQGPVATGSFTFLGASNNGTVNPLGVTLDNVTVDTIASSNLIAPSNARITLGPGQVSSSLVALLNNYNGINGNIITDARTAPALVPPACVFTFLAPSLTGPAGVSQTVVNGQYPTAVVILQPAFASTSYPYPTGTVTVTDEGGRSVSATLPGTGDTVFIPITNAPVGTHTYTASYSGNTVYPAQNGFGNYTATVNSGSLAVSTTALSGVPAMTTFGTPFTAMATVSGPGAPAGSVSFLLNGSVYTTVPLTNGAATFTFNLPIGTYAISAVYSGDASNGGSASAASSVAIAGAPTTTTLQTSATTTTVGTPVTLTATVASAAGVPSGTVVFSYTNATTTTPTNLGSAAVANGVATFNALLPQGTDSLFATYAASGNYGGSASTSTVTVMVNAAPPVPAATLPLALPYLLSTVAGGAAVANNATCTGHTDTFGDGCQATAVGITGTGTALDLRSVTVDPFGNIYFTDANAALVRKISQTGIITNFAGYITGTACVPTATVGCTPTLVKLTGKPRGIYSDPAGNVFIAGYNDNKVHMVRASDGKMYLVAGTGTGPTNTTDSAGDGGSAISALLKGPRAIGTDSAGNVYIADSGDNRIREVLNPASGLPGAGVIQTVAGTGVNTSTGDGGLATAATISNPQGVALDTSGNIYIAEGSHVRAVCVACSPGTGLAALLNKVGVASPANGNIYTVAGTSSSANTTLAPGLGTSVNMGPQKIALDPNGNIYIADSSNNVIWFEDGRTGYTRLLAGGGTATSCTGSAIGDGCPATQGIVGSNSGNGMGLGLDVQGNLYISDSTNGRIRKVSNDLRFASTAVGTPATQTVKLHFLPNDAPTTATVSSTDFTLSTGTCAQNSADTTTDCTYTATFKPVVAGLRRAPLAVATSLGNPGVLGLSGTGLGAGATLDPARQITFGQNILASAIAVDNAGNVLVADATSKSVLRYAPGPGGVGGGVSATATTLQTFTNPSALATDSLGDVFVADASTGLVSVIAPSGATRTLATTFTSPTGLAVDALDNLYVADASAKTVTQVGSNLTATRTVASGLNTPGGLAADAGANIFIADSGAGTVYRIDSQTFARTSASAVAASPRAVAVDAAGNLLIADGAVGQVLAVPFATPNAPVVVATGIEGIAIALDSVGNVYTSSGTNQVLVLQRTQALATYNGHAAPPSTISLLSTGNQAASLSLSDPDQTNFSLTLTTSATCTGSASAFSVAVGGACQFTSSFTPTSANNFTNTATLSGNAANATIATPAALQIVQVGNNAPFATTTAISYTPASPFVGDTVMLTATVSSAGGIPAGTVIFSVDGSASSPVAVSNGVASISIVASTAGGHVVRAVFTSNDTSFAGSTAPAITITFAAANATAQNVWIVNGNSTLSELSNAGAAISGTSGYLGGGSGIAIDNSGNVWSGSGASAVTKFSRNGTVTGTYNGAGISSPVGIAVSGEGVIWIANRNNTVSVLANDGAAITPASGFSDSTLSTPSSITIDSSGNVWVANTGDSSVTEFLGAAAPVVTPLAAAAKAGAQGVKP